MSSLIVHVDLFVLKWLLICDLWSRDITCFGVIEDVVRLSPHTLIIHAKARDFGPYRICANTSNKHPWLSNPAGQSSVWVCVS